MKFLANIASLLLFLATLGYTHQAEAQQDTVLITSLKSVDGLQSLDGEPYSGEAYFLNKDGSPMVMRSYVEGIKEGVWRTWHSNGNLYKEGATKNDLEHGEYLEYYENGVQRYEYHYDLGKKTGTWLGWYESGQAYTERNFKDDVLHGRLMHWDEDGTAKLEEYYQMGRLAVSDRFKVKGGGSGVTIKQTKE